MKEWFHCGILFSIIFFFPALPFSAQTDTSFLIEIPQEQFSNFSAFEQFIPLAESNTIILHKFDLEPEFSTITKIDYNQKKSIDYNVQVDNNYPLYNLKEEKFNNYYAFYYTPHTKYSFIFIIHPDSLMAKKTLTISTQYEFPYYKPQSLDFVTDTSLIFTFNTLALTSSNNYLRALGIAMWDFSIDSILWAKSYFVDTDSIQLYYPTFMQKITSESALVAGVMIDAASNKSGFLLKINTQTGDILTTSSFPANGINILAKQIKASRDSLDYFYVTSVLKRQGDSLPAGVIFKLSKNFELLWAKKNGGG